MKRTLVAIAIATLSLAFAPSIWASASLNQIGVAHDTQGNQYLAAWKTDTGALVTCLVDAEGVPQGVPNTLSSIRSFNPSVAYDSDLNRFLVVWSESSDDVVVALKCRIVTSTGVPSGGEIIIDDDLSYMPSPKVVYSSHSQRYLIVFTRFSAISAQYVSGDGTLYGSAFDAIPGTSHAGFWNADSPAVAYDSVNHHFLVLGLLFGSGAPPISVYGAMVNDVDAIAMYQAPFSILDSDTYLYPPAVAFDSANQRFLAVWEVYTGTGHNLHGRLVNADGSLYGSPLAIVSDASVSFANDVAYKGGDGRYLVAWLDSGISAQEVGAEGVNFGERLTLADAAYPYNLALAYNSVSENTLLAYNPSDTTKGFIVTTQLEPADLSVTISGPDKAILDQLLEYGITVTNLSDDEATEVELTIEVPDGVSYINTVPSQGVCEYEAGTVTCDLGTIAADSNATASLQMIPTEMGVITLTAAVSGAGVDPDPINNSASLDTLIQRNLNLSPAAGTTGTEIEISGDDFGARKGKVALVGTGKPVNLKVISWNEGGSGIIRAVISKAPPVGAYDVSVLPKEPKGAAAIIEEDAFDVMAPEITGCPISGYASEILTMNGSCLGARKGQIYVEYSDQGRIMRKACKVLLWPTDSDGGTLSGAVQFTLPKGVPAGDWSLIVNNKVGEDRVAFTVLN